MKKTDRPYRKKSAGSRTPPRAKHAQSEDSRHGRRLAGPTVTSVTPSQIEARFRAIFEHSRDAIGVSKAGIHVCVNPAYLDLFGYPRGTELAGKPVLDLIAPESRDQVKAHIFRRMQGEAVPSIYVTRGLRADGASFDMEVSVSVYQENEEDHTLVILRDITDRKRAEHELAERGAMLEQIMDTASVAIGLVDKSGRITHANRRMAEMFGCSMEELVGSEYVDHVHPSERETGRRNMMALLASKIPSVDLERLYWRKDGTQFWGHLACRRFHDARGNELGLIGVITDISERHKSEMALKKSEEKYRRLYNETPVLLHSIDRNGIVVEVNDHWLTTMGYERKEVIGRKVTDFFTAASRTYAREVIQPEFFRTGVARDVAYQFVRRNGDVLDVLLSATAERDAAGAIVRSQAVIVDITERKQAESALRENQARLDLALQSAHMGVWRWELGENRRYFDELTCRLLGIEAATFTGAEDEFFQAVHPEDREKVKAAIGRTLAQDAPYEPSYRVAWPDGSVRHITARGRLVRDDRGRSVRINGILWDVTEQRLLEQELIKNQKLESIGTLAGGIAHDFNNLLQGIFGYISLAKSNIDRKDKAVAMLDQAEQALHQSVNLTSQLLTFSKGGKPIKKPIALGSLIENSVKFALSGSRVVAEFSIAADLRAVEADEGQLGQVLQNIVLNADQAMPLGGTITIRAGNVPASGLPSRMINAEGMIVAISVQDQGTGIPPEHQSRIFDPYFTTKDKGSGLGLATSYSIIRNHGGAITVSSELGKGSTFTLYLPASAASAEKAEPSRERTTARKGRILVMDDEKVVREVAGEIIRSLGHEVAHAEHGESAVRQCEQAMKEGRPFDVVILDLTIRGGMGGVDAAARLHELDPRVKAVVSSGYSDDAVMVDYLQRGFKAFLKKPYDIDDVCKVLNDVME